VRFIGLDVHKDFCEVAISDGGKARSAGRVKTTRAELELFAQSLGRDDKVALEATGNTLAIARILEPYVAEVVIANSRKLRAIYEAKVKNDKVDARTLAELGVDARRAHAAAASPDLEAGAARAPRRPAEEPHLRDAAAQPDHGGSLHRPLRQARARLARLA
jgi:hypothetical protein